MIIIMYFRGEDHDLILIPVDSSHALLLAGKGLADSDRILQTVEGMLFVRGDVENILRTLGVTTDNMEQNQMSLRMKRAKTSIPGLRIWRM